MHEHLLALLLLSASATVLTTVSAATDPVILVVFDLHRSINQDGECFDPDIRAIEMVMTMQWMERRNSSNQVASLGVLDTCGSIARAVQLIGPHIQPDSCTSPPNTAGVISYTSPEVSVAIRDLLRHSGIFHIALQDTVPSIPLPAEEPPNYLQLLLPSGRLIQNAVELLKHLNWMYVSTQALDRPRATAEEMLFKEAAAVAGICSGAMTSHESKGQVIFVSGADDSLLRTTLSNAFNASSKAVIIASDAQTIDKIAKMNVLWTGLVLAEEHPPNGDIIAAAITGNLFGSWITIDSVTAEYYRNTLGCMRNNTTWNMQCETGKIQDYFTTRSSSRDISASMSAYTIMHRSIGKAVFAGCSQFQLDKCPSMLPENPSVPDPQLYFTNIKDGIVLDKAFSVSVHIIKPLSASIQIGTVYDANFSPNQSLWDEANILFSSFLCNRTCSEWSLCHKRFDDTALSMQQDGDILISGVFPIHTMSAMGVACGAWSWEGLQAAEAFMYAIRTVRSRHPGKLVLPALGGVVTDACENSGKSICGTSGLEFCGHISSAVRHDSEATESFAIDAKEPALVVSELGITLHRLGSERYMEALTKTLNRLRWTYVVVVYSANRNSGEFIGQWKASLQKHDICIGTEIQVTPENIANALQEIPNDSGTILLLTDHFITGMILEVLSDTSLKVGNKNLVFFPWNKNTIAKLSNKDTILGSVLVELKQEDISDFDFLKFLTLETSQRNPWLEDFHQWRFGCYAAGGVVDFDDVCWRKSTSSGLTVSSLLSYIAKSVDTLVFALDAIYKEECPQKNGLCDKFRSQTVQKRLDIALREVSLDSNGQLIQLSPIGSMTLPMQVFNYQKEGDNVVKRMVGTFNTSGTLVLDKNDVKTYSSDGREYISNSECSGWCPSCYKCPTPRQQSRDFFYQAGDLVVSGLFAIHTHGQGAFECGSLNTANYTDVMVEAFLYAVSTAKSRYPSLLSNVSLGSLVVDTCSDASQSLMSVLNFESCEYVYQQGDEPWPASPRIVKGYVVSDQYAVVKPVASAIRQLEKLVFTPSSSGERSTLDLTSALSTTKAMVLAVVDVLEKLNWTFVSVVVSDTEGTQVPEMFSEMTLARNICVANVFNITAMDQNTIDSALDYLRGSNVKVAVMLAEKKDALQFFETQEYRPLSQSWILAQTSVDWKDSDERVTPLGTILLGRKDFLNTGFKSYFEELVANNSRLSNNPWLDVFNGERCSAGIGSNSCPTLYADTKTWRTASEIIKAVDIILHAWNVVYQEECSNNQGLCQQFAVKMNDDITKALSRVSFVSNGEVIRFTQVEGIQGTYVAKNRHSGDVTPQVGEWNSGGLQLEIQNLKAYNKYGQRLTSFPVSYCTQDCGCLNGVITPDSSKTDSELQFWKTSSKFHGEIWAIVVVTVVGTGIFMTLLVTLYVLCKVCAGALMKRYIALGLTMLLAIMLLYLSALPFLFTPSHMVCGMRFFAPGFTYAFSFGIILVKLMSLREYKLIGLGGEVSNLNQFLTVLFITGVQIAIGVQWWVLKGSLLVEVDHDGVSLYACNFVRKDFAIYLVYVMFLMILCAIYAIIMRKDTKNMGESRLLLACSLICITSWIVWIIVMMIQPRSWVEPTVCVGILVCASLMLLVTFIPKVLKIAQLKYDVTVKSRPENGYKIDNDFFFERPYSLPGTLRSSGSEKNISTFPRSIATFDTSLSY